MSMRLCVVWVSRIFSRARHFPVLSTFLLASYFCFSGSHRSRIAQRDVARDAVERGRNLISSFARSSFFLCFFNDILEWLGSLGRDKFDRSSLSLSRSRRQRSKSNFRAKFMSVANLQQSQISIINAQRHANTQSDRREFSFLNIFTLRPWPSK